MKILVVSQTVNEEELLGARDLILSCMPGTTVYMGQDQDGKPNSDVLAESHDVDVVLSIEYEEGNLTGKGCFFGRESEGVQVHLASSQIHEIKKLPAVGKEKLEKLLVKQLVKKLLEPLMDIQIPWGTLTGIRPSKLMHHMDDLGIGEAGKRAILEHRYAVRLDKIQLLEEIDRIQKPFIEEFKRDSKKVSLYVSIPFCPSRCSYCTFPGTVLKNGRTEIEDYLSGLEKEILQVGKLMDEYGLSVQNLYLGGGTPTLLNERELERLIIALKRLPYYSDLEFTVEAGRPDTLNSGKFSLFKALGVNRISINPQTMEERTLKRIGRAHSAEQIIEAFAKAREFHDWTINMDLILGLPGEGMAEVKNTLKEIEKLGPDNLTLHVLALKRGSKEWETGYTHISARQMEAIGELAWATARSMNMHPYYLYRQRRMAGNLENVGFAKPGHECRYNIAIMEERQQILGLGAGSASKILDPATYKLENIQHSYDWKTYLKSWPKDHERRTKSLAKVYSEKG